jgi:hypothetical protein
MIRQITIEEGNRHFRVLGDFVMDIEGVTIVRYFGNDQNLTLSCEIETLGVGCFCACSGLSSLAFEGGSRLKRIEAEALSHCSGLKSICIPASVEILCAGCFYWSRLSSLTFEAESKLKEIEVNVFSMCSSLRSLSIPASVKIIHGSAFEMSAIAKIIIEEGNSDFGFCGYFLINLTATSVVRYFGNRQAISLKSEIESLCTEYFTPSSLIFEPGSKLRRIEAHAFANCSELKSISIPASVESLGEECFAYCNSLSSVIFESGSKLLRIEAGAFAKCCALTSISIPASVESLGEKCFFDCEFISSVIFESGSKLVRIHARVFDSSPSLKSIVIPRSIQELVKDWALRSSLEEVIFESAASLQRMLDGDCADLSGGFVIKIEECDSDIGSLGSSIGRQFKEFSHLVH